ncbi:MAG: hypothetical protein MJ069_07035 [Salinivirgaceae bacterium]|nr:hypothetical protein [Salinivirgaceae bacterium]
MKRHFYFAFAALLFGACSQSVQTAPQSTVVNADGTVTFNYRNDKAKQVQVDVQFAGRHAMVKDSATGLWSLTLGPAAPDMYPYCFVVDGVSVMDPENQQWFPNEGFKNSILDIPAKNAPLIHSIQNVPHGNVEYISYYSESIGTYNNAIVYLPPKYNQSADSYPVFYLISGTTDTEEVYYKVGRMNFILDNLIAQGAAKEMIVVLPYGNPMKLMKQPMQGASMFRDFFTADLVGDLMPYVESHYCTINDRDHRAIGGFSRGGNQGLAAGLTNLDKFSYLCSYSSFTSTALPNVYDNAAETNDKLHLFWSGVGTDDFLFGNARDYTEFLDQKGIRCVKEYTHDKFGHTWMNAKYFLDITYRLLFNEEASAKAMANAQPTMAKTGEEQQFTPGVMARLFPRPILSPEINGANVTFRIKAENAENVQLVGEMLSQPMNMERDSVGVWSATVTGLAAEVYCYNFVVDGTQVADAQNMYLAPDNGFKRSILDLTSTDNRYNYSPVCYQVKADGSTFATVVPNVENSSELPAVALVAGANDTFESWFKIAQANKILDEMVADGKCKPCELRLLPSGKVDGKFKAVLNSADYKTWAEARAALVSVLEKL